MHCHRQRIWAGKSIWTAVLALCLVALVQLAAQAQPVQSRPVYVGSQVCASCHDGPGAGYQYSRWLLSKHARAYAALSLPEAKAIARISGVPIEPTKSPLCLGCHGTAAHAEPWELEATFRANEGVQCEACHGPGSEYIPVHHLKDRKLSQDKGMMLPAKEDCIICHGEKGSHTAVLGSKKFDINKAWEEVAHPSPVPFKEPEKPVLTAKAESKPGEPHYIGSHACSACHDGPGMNFQYSKWVLSAHARAYASLSTPEAYRIAAEWGVEGSPQKSQRCLECHSTIHADNGAKVKESFSIYEGVGCEACHGAGSEFAVEAIMRDPRAARQAGLKDVTESLCLRCHENAHGKPFDLAVAWKAIAHPLRPPADKTALPTPVYKNPRAIAVRPDGKEAYVACESAHVVAVVDLVERRLVAEIPVGWQPSGIAISPDGRWVYVSNRWDDNVSVVDVQARREVARISVGDEPMGIAVSPDGQRVFVANSAHDDISVISVSGLVEEKRLAGSRSPWAIRVSPDGEVVLVSHALPRLGRFRTRLDTELTVIEAARAVVEDRLTVPDANLLLDIAWHPTGKFALATLNRTKSNVPMTRLLQGWTITNGLAIIWRDGRINQVLLDEPQLGFADPTSIVITPDGRWALVTSAGTDRIGVVDIEQLLRIVESADPYERDNILPNHLAPATEFVVKHIPTGANPRAIALVPGGKFALVAETLDDMLAILDLETMEIVDRIDLGGPKVLTKARFGERLFHNAKITFRRQFTCNTCHPNGHIDGITYDIEPDGIGLSPVDNKTVRGILDTAPFKWEGTNPSLARQCGARLGVFFTRIQPYTPEELSAVDYYLSTIPRPPNRYRPLGAELTEAQRRGREIFYRTRKTDGTEIPRENRCITCHPPPLYTDRRQHDVGTQMWLDRQGKFDTPHLNNIYDSAPYLHNGIAHTLEEIWTLYNPNDTHGVTNDLTKDQLNDLIEFLKTL
ncbi:MAG: beta-propeller fold lactonase family protein [Thermoguttaceae bacterium]|nr:beta-propeller fold lactonase family protein [Thermoguttaceae bacterium]MDW8077669.1 multiheme c-type cytochrome [Thermoguttaceae bacterium]